MILDIPGLVRDTLNGADELFTSDEERGRLELAVLRVLNQPHILQAMTNIEEAKHPSIFVAGWRPALGWLCVVLLTYAWIGRDILIVMLLLGERYEIVSYLPEIDFAQLMTLVLALLGLGAARTYERVKGVARQTWTKPEQ
ncbi:MAG: holin family protein [Candidatus Thiodiazotropha taylori]|uniref:Holin family protein n=1 Tax=Candidatus Thiodiazotropha taylori TaxID=2792791 RepID=A0A9E4N3K7_9GAMM|nr:holin family protein [Candidatus Thiodiazotropha taylori]MCW4255970.1 holin family protein [Candidatus Thiodiazotropha taylori]